MDRVLAIATVRFKLLARRMRGTSGVVNLISAVLMWLVGTAAALGLAGGAGVIVHLTVISGPPSIFNGLLAVFYGCSFFAFFLPLLRGALDQGFDASPFLIYPISRRQLFLITLGTCSASSEHLLYMPALLAVAIAGVLIPGVNVLAGLVLLLLIALFYISWSNLLTLFLVGIMRARRIKEILSGVAILSILAVSVLPAILESVAGGPRALFTALLDAFAPLRWMATSLPPTLAASGLAALHGPGAAAGPVLWSILGLLAWNGAGIGLGYLVFNRYHLGDRSSRRRQPTRPSETTTVWHDGLLSFDSRVFAGLPAEVRATAAKDLHYLLRSLVGRFNLFVAPLLVLVMSVFVGEIVKQPLFGIDPQRLVLFGILWYSTLFSNNFVNNAFAWESGGINAYFISPVSLRRVLAGKNLAVWIYNAVLFCLMLATWSIVIGPPDPPTFLTAVLFYAATVLITTIWGNIASILFPIRREVAGLRNSPSQVATLLSMVLLALMLVLIGPFISIPLLLGWTWMQPLALAMLLGAVVGVYALSLGPAARLFGRRKDRLIESLKAPG